MSLHSYLILPKNLLFDKTIEFIIVERIAMRYNNHASRHQQNIVLRMYNLSRGQYPIMEFAGEEDAGEYTILDLLNHDHNEHRLVELKQRFVKVYLLGNL